ncbi:MAG: metal ABC transporter substrate-binding protein [Rhizobiales bacterium]|nr:metal ABC transporter substrate-binding protein [Hyphomicrobiales bacterium]
MKKILLSILFAMALAHPVMAKPLNVVASFSILGNMVHEVAGDSVILTTLVGPDGDAHDFEPSPIDAKKLAEADLVFLNGLNFESWFQRLAAASGTKAVFVNTSFGIQPRQMNEDGQDVLDPHAWQNLANGKIYVRNIRDALVKADPKNRATYEANAAGYLARIDALDSWVRTEINALPRDKRKVITTHDAFGYFGEAYGVTFLAPEGISTDAEPGARDLARLIDEIRAKKIRALFIENMTDPRMMQTISKETGAHLPEGEAAELYSDALSKPDGPAPTYLDMFRNNVPKLVKAMGQN